MVILLHETEHFFRIFNKIYKKDKIIFSNTPNNKEGGKLFIKYLFGVFTINHINLTQSEHIFNEENWKETDKLKTIFSGQLEDYEDNYVSNEFLRNYFPNSISFFSTRKGNKYSKKSRLYSSIKK